MKFYQKKRISRLVLVELDELIPKILVLDLKATCGRSRNQGSAWGGRPEPEISTRKKKLILNPARI